MAGLKKARRLAAKQAETAKPKRKYQGKVLTASGPTVSVTAEKPSPVMTTENTRIR